MMKLIICAALLVVAGAPCWAQQATRISFVPGASEAKVEGKVTGHDHRDYIVEAQGGQAMVVTLTVTGTNGNGTAYFNILPAGQDYGGPYVGSTDDDREADITVPSDGDWTIRVYLMGNDRDAGKTVDFRLHVGLSEENQSPMVAEEDFFIVNLSSPSGVLNIRAMPGVDGKQIGTVKNGSVLQNVGGCVIQGGEQWCAVRSIADDARGWVAGRFLRVPAPEDGQPARDGVEETSPEN